MKYKTDQFERVLERLISSTCSPRGKYAAAPTYALLERMLFPRKSHRLLIRHFIAGAAMIALLCVPIWWVCEDMNKVVMQEVHCAAEMKEVRLPDGTRVTLNHFSTLSFPKEFKQKEREVMLDGEAYFEVTKDQKHPFVVRTRAVDVKVLGTHFDVNAYKRNRDVKAILYEGSVAVRSKEGRMQQALLKPGEMAVFDKQSKTLKQMIAKHAADDIAWKRGYLIFDNCSIEELAAALSNSFGVSIQVPDKNLQQYKITARFRHNENLNTILSILQEAGYFKYSLDRKRIILKSSI